MLHAQTLLMLVCMFLDPHYVEHATTMCLCLLQAYTYIRIYIYIYIYIYVLCKFAALKNTHIHTYIHTYTHTHTHTPGGSRRVFRSSDRSQRQRRPRLFVWEELRGPKRLGFYQKTVSGGIC